MPPCLSASTTAAIRSPTGLPLLSCNAFVTGAGALFQPAVGWLLDPRWDGTLADGARVYAADDFRVALALVVAGTVAGALAVVFVREPARRH